MNTDLKFKLLQYLNYKKQPSGFSFWTLLAIIVLIGVGIVIVLPSFFSKGCACQPEARTYVGTINKAEQAYYTEKNSFNSDIVALGVGIRTASINYNYYVKVINKGTQSVVIGYSATTSAGAALKNYVGYASLIPAGGSSTEVTSVAILCQQKTAGTLSLDVEWKPGIESPRCNKDQVSVGGTE